MTLEIDADKLLENALRDGAREAIKSRLTQSYQNPFDATIAAVFAKNEAVIRGLLSDCLASCFNDPAFREQIAASVRATLAKTLVSRFGGELEKAVNALKSDPVTRAKIVTAIDEIVKGRLSTP